MHISAELSPVELPVGCGNVSQATLGWSLRTVVLQPFGTEVDFFFFFLVPKPAGLCTQFCLKLASALD